MSTADLAIVAIAAVSLAHGGWEYRIRMRLADRVRVVNPPKPQQQAQDSEAAENPAGKPLKAAS